MANKIFTLKIRKVDTTDGDEEEGSAKKELGLFDNALYADIFFLRDTFIITSSFDLAICKKRPTQC